MITFLKGLLIVLVMIALVLGIMTTAPVAFASGPLQAFPPIAMTPEALAAISGAVLSLFLAYIPGLKNWYMPQPGETKALIMLILILAAGIVIFLLSCGGFLSVGLSCDRQGIVTVILTILAALVTNQSTYTLAVEPFKSD